MLKKVFLILIALGLAAWIGYLLLYAFASHETRIRWLLQDMATSFNDGSAGGVARRLAEDFVDEDHNLDRATVHGYLAAFFVRQKLEHGNFPYHAEILDPDVIPELSEEDRIRIGVDDSDPPKATLGVRVRFSELIGENERKPIGVAEFHATCVIEDGRWRLVRAGMRVLEGRMPR